MSARYSFSLDALENRTLFSASAASNNEQLMLELINRARANPTAEAARDGIDLNEGLSAGTISAAAKQPLVMNGFLVSSGRAHSQWMLDTDTFSHYGVNGSSPGDRMTSAGYSFVPSYAWGENIAWRGTTGSISEQPTVPLLHNDFFIDSGVADRGHRINLMDASYKEVGIGLRDGNFSGYNAVMVTEDFAFSGTKTYITGVAYTDAITKNSFYTPGEGIGGITITATRASDGQVFTTTAAGTGGYAVAVPPGVYAVKTSSSQLNGTVTVNNITVGSSNVKVDFTPQAAPVTPPVTPPIVNAPKAPTVTMKAIKIIKKGGSSLVFSVTYHSAGKIRTSSFDTNDLRLVGPKGYSKLARFSFATPSSDSSTIVATYVMRAPGGLFDKPDNGIYKIYMRTTQVNDTNNLFVKYGIFSKVTIAIPK